MASTGVWFHTRYMRTGSPETPSSETLIDLQIGRTRNSSHLKETTSYIVSDSCAWIPIRRLNQDRSDFPIGLAVGIDEIGYGAADKKAVGRVLIRYTTQLIARYVGSAAQFHAGIARINLKVSFNCESLRRTEHHGEP